jgi:hypothetical protein
MITLQEFKDYIHITETDNDLILQGFITTAISQLESMCNRKFINDLRTEYLYHCIYDKRIYLKNGNINSVVSVKYWYDDEYVTILEPADALCDVVQCREDFIYLVKGYSLLGKDVEIVYNSGYKFQTGTGTVNIVSGSKDITGVGTYFTDEIAVGDYVLINGQRIKVSVINSATSMTLESAMSETENYLSFNISNVPEDLRQACKELSAKLYYDSGIGLNALIKSNESVSGTTSGTSTTFKELNMDKIVNQYRYINI